MTVVGRDGEDGGEVRFEAKGERVDRIRKSGGGGGGMHPHYVESYSVN